MSYFIPIAQNVLSLYGVRMYGALVDSSSRSFHPGNKLVHFFFYVQLSAFREIAKNSPLSTTFPLVERSIVVLTSTVGWSLFIRNLLDFAGLKHSSLRNFWIRLDEIYCSLSPNLTQALSVFSLYAIIFHKDPSALGILIPLALRWLKMNPSSIALPLGVLGAIYVSPGTALILGIVSRFRPREDQSLHRVPDKLKDYTNLMLANYIEGIKRGTAVIKELLSKNPEDQNLLEIIDNVQSEFEYYIPARFALLKEISNLAPSQKYLIHLPDRKQALEDLSEQYNELTKEEIAIIERALILGAEEIPANRLPLKNIVEQICKFSNIYAATYNGSEDSANFRPNFLQDESAKKARKEFGL